MYTGIKSTLHDSSVMDCIEMYQFIFTFHYIKSSLSLFNVRYQLSIILDKTISSFILIKDRHRSYRHTALKAVYLLSSNLSLYVNNNSVFLQLLCICNVGGEVHPMMNIY